MKQISTEILSTSTMLSAMKAVPEDVWQPGLERARRNLNRILDVQQQVEDIMQDRPYKTRALLSLVLGECSDELEALAADETGEESVAGRIRKRIEEIFGGKEDVIAEIDPAGLLGQRIGVLKARFTHREVEIVSDLEEGAPFIRIPSDVFQKVVDGLIRNAVENTPDEGKIEIKVRKRGNGIELVVHDYGVGITAENQRHIFEGFFVTRDTMAYSSQRPFDFNAGGKGADLLRMKIFCERYNFKINMTSSRCQFIPHDSDICPGKISRCAFCKGKEVCYHSGGTVFALFFPFKT